jgi:hypothetical protein
MSRDATKVDICLSGGQEPACTAGYFTIAGNAEANVASEKEVYSFDHSGSSHGFSPTGPFFCRLEDQSDSASELFPVLGNKGRQTQAYGSVAIVSACMCSSRIHRSKTLPGGAVRR